MARKRDEEFGVRRFESSLVKKNHPLLKQYNTVMDKIERIQSQFDENEIVKIDLIKKTQYNTQKFDSLMKICSENTENPLTTQQINSIISTPSLLNFYLATKILPDSKSNSGQIHAPIPLSATPDDQGTKISSFKPPSTFSPTKWNSKFKSISEAFTYYSKLKDTILHNYQSNRQKYTDSYKRSNGILHKQK